MSSPPRVFISYSYDSEEHQAWVEQFASSLLKNGVQVVLDRWELHLGDDLLKFMEREIADCDRVLMICTGPYVQKVNAGRGGAGYEGMLVAGELVRSLGVNKFIPILRQTGEPTLPHCLGKRLYVDFGDAALFDTQIDVLLRDLHNIRIKPKLGVNPFSPNSSIETDLSTCTNSIHNPPYSGELAVPPATSLVSLLRGKPEQAIQDYLTAHPSLLLLAFGSPLSLHGPVSDVCFARFAFGAEFVCDFVVVSGTSLSYRVTLVELELPESMPFTKNGRFSQCLNEAIQQVDSWRSWVDENYTAFKRSLAERLRLAGNDELADGLCQHERNITLLGKVIIGRREMFTSRDDARRLLMLNAGLEVVPYDRLCEIEFKLGVPDGRNR